MWTTENRHRYDRDNLRYPSDLTDSEWQLIKPLIPPAKRGGGKRTVNMREVVNGVMYVLSTGCPWRYIPKDLPPRSTVNGYFCLWRWDGTLQKIHQSLYVKCRGQADHEVSPTACVMHVQVAWPSGKRPVIPEVTATSGVSGEIPLVVCYECP